MKKLNFRHLNWFLLIAFLAFSVWAYGELPVKVASHWDMHGQADGYIGRFWGAFLFPLISLLVFLLLIWIPRIDPRKKNIAAFRPYFDRFIFASLIFFIYIYSLTIWWNIHGSFDMNRLLVPGMAFLFWEVGVLVSKAKSNWFIGIRTPWTLSSEKVWNSTHALGGKLFKSAAIVSLLGIVWPEQFLWFLIIPVLAITVVLLAYSYFAYKKEWRPKAKKAKK
jgi:uncharacterized membrane protein